ERSKMLAEVPWLAGCLEKRASLSPREDDRYAKAINNYRGARISHTPRIFGRNRVVAFGGKRCRFHRLGLHNHCAAEMICLMAVNLKNPTEISSLSGLFTVLGQSHPVRGYANVYRGHPDKKYALT